MDAKGRDVFIIDARRDGKQFIVRANNKLTAFRKLESEIRVAAQPSKSGPTETPGRAN